MTFFDDYFVKPIIEGSGYNIVNTVTYGLLFIISLFAVKKILVHLQIKTDKKLWWKLTPLVISAGLLRALQDHHLFSFMALFQYLFVTPFIYLLIFAIAITLLLLERKIKNITIYVSSVMAIFLFFFVAVMARQWYYFSIAIALLVLSISITFLLMKITRMKFMDKINWSVVVAQTLDACSSFTAISVMGSFAEQHVVPNIIFSQLPFYLFIPLKVSLAVFAVYVIDREVRGAWNWLLKFSILVLGLGPGTRNLMTMLISN
ncbi:hypothetical protein DRN74_00280 [Candidatus Micrarchaeota archaeon]|nr:MAG: hypothetical protein DRN74_00280 [Candidatus Micrarchaeota archaeon]